MNFLASLIHSDDRHVDSIIIGGLLALGGLVAYAGWAVWSDPHTFNPLTYGGGAASILGGWGGARRLRDGIGDATATATPTSVSTSTPAS